MTSSEQLTLDERLLLNQLAQGIVSRAEGDAWFRGKSVEEQRAALQGLNGLILQAGSQPGDGESALLASQERLARMAHLPPVELPRVFQLLIKLLAVADRRRRTEQPLNPARRS